MRILKSLAISFSIIGLVLLTYSCLNYFNKKKFMKISQKTTGIIVDFKTIGKGIKSKQFPRISYIASDGDSVLFVSPLISHLQKGDNVKIRYIDDSAARHSRIDTPASLWFYTIYNAFFGAISLIIGIILFTIIFLKLKKVKNINQIGKKIKASFESVEKDKNVKINFRNPYKIICSWKNPKDKTIHKFSSESIWFDPSLYIKKNQKIIVIIDKNNLNNYIVDISFLPNQENKGTS